MALAEVLLPTGSSEAAAGPSASSSTAEGTSHPLPHP